MRRSILLLFVLSIAPVGTHGSEPAALSPGDPDGFPRSDECPAFSWAVHDPASAHELVVFRVPARRSEEAALRLRALVPAGASSWSPPKAGCLEPGRYAWTLRSVEIDGDGAWAAPRMFVVAAGPRGEDLRWALEILRRHRAGGGLLDGDLDQALESFDADPGLPVAEDRAAVTVGTADAVGLRARRAGTAAAVAVHAVSAGDDGSAAVVGESTASTGRSDGVRIVANSDDGTALELAQDGLGRLLLALGPVAGDVMRVEADGALATGELVGDGSRLTGAPQGLICTACVSGADVADGAVQTHHLGVESVGSAKLASGAVGSGQLADGSVGGAAIRNDAVTAQHLAPASVVSRTVADGAVTSPKLQDGAAAAADLAPRAISRDQISGTEVRVYALHSSCSYPDTATIESTCDSRLCLGFPVTYLDCAGNCNRSGPVICANANKGFLLGLDALE